MRFSFTMSRYLTREFLLGLGIALGIFASLVLLLDTVELLRRAAGREMASAGAVLQMALLKLPAMLHKTLPFAVLIGSILALNRLNRRSEITVMRGSGLAVWQFLMPGMVVAAAAALLFITTISPLSASMLLRFEQLEARYLEGRTSLLSVSDSGLWLREKYTDEKGRRSEAIIHALRVSQQDMTLYDVILFVYDGESRFLGRIDAAEARLMDGYWALKDVLLSSPKRRTEAREAFRLATTLDLRRIQESFASPETLSFWKLPGFIDSLKEAGFSAVQHVLHFHVLLASPLLYAGMVLVAALFSLRLHRRGKAGRLIAAGVFSGFVIYFLSDLIYALGLSGSLPVWLAAWAPPLIVMSAGSALLIHVEEK